tara:strand:- start:518 stop:649 length:132 start_codon:yes stop_codon:yes gene_type:complete
MIKKIILILFLFCSVVSCGKKGDPEYTDPNEKAKIYKIVINLA